MIDTATPHACFRVASGSTVGGRELLIALRDVVSLQSGILPIKMAGLFHANSLIVKVEDKLFSVVLVRSKYDSAEWVLSVGSLDGKSIFDSFLKNIPQLLKLSKCVHNFLAKNHEISDVRWYFEGRSSQSQAVTVPEDLPWDTWSPNP